MKGSSLLLTELMKGSSLLLTNYALDERALPVASLARAARVRTRRQDTRSAADGPCGKGSRTVKTINTRLDLFLQFQSWRPFSTSCWEHRPGTAWASSAGLARRSGSDAQTNHTFVPHHQLRIGLTLFYPGLNSRNATISPARFVNPWRSAHAGAIGRVRFRTARGGHREVLPLRARGQATGKL